MSGLQQASGAPIEITLGDKSYRMSPLTRRDIEELDNYVRATVMTTARASLPQDASEEQKKLTEETALRTAMSMSWMTGEGARLMSSLTGWSRILWQGLRYNHPELTPDSIAALLLDPTNLEQAQKRWHLLNIGPPKVDKKGGQPKHGGKKRERKRLSR